MAHTPGPWLIDDLHEDEVVILADIITVDNSLNIATICGGLELGERAANAFLIAAAPDMLAALKLVNENWARNNGSVLDCVQAAIIKAEGRQRPVRKSP